VNWNRLVLGAVALVVAVAAVDALRNGQDAGEARYGGYRIDLESARDGTGLAVSKLRDAFPAYTPESLAVSQVAVAPDAVVAVGVSHVPGDRPAQAAVEIWDGDELLRAFAVEPGSFSRGLWFAAEGRAIATIGADGRGYLYDRDGRRISGTAYFAYETR
jgi:hypothetical protein